MELCPRKAYLTTGQGSRRRDPQKMPPLRAPTFSGERPGTELSGLTGAVAAFQLLWRPARSLLSGLALLFLSSLKQDPCVL